MRILLFIFIVNIICSHGQSVNWGNAVKKKRTYQMLDIIHYESDVTFVLAYQSGKYLIETVNSKNEISESATLRLKYKRKDLRFVDIIPFNGKLVLFSSFSNQKLKRNFLFYQVIDKDSLRSPGRLVKVAEIPYSKKREDGYFSITLSSDSSKLAIFSGLPVIDDGPERFGLAVINENFEVLWNQGLGNLNLNQVFTFERMDVSNSGDIYLSGVTADKPMRKNRQEEPSFKYHLISFTQLGTETHDFEIDIDKKFITDLQFRVDDNDKLHCAGFYSENGIWSIKGAFYIVIDGLSNQLLSTTFRTFPEEFITDGWSDRQIKRAERQEERKGISKELYEYDLKDFVLTQDNSAILIAEQFYRYVETVTDFNAQGALSTRTVTHFHYNDILAVHINEHGEIEWLKKIRKQQHSINDGGFYSSFCMGVVDNSIPMLYTIPSNQFYKEEQLDSMRRSDRREQIAVLTTLSLEGKIRSEKLYSQSEVSIRLRPKVCGQLNRNTFLIYGKDGRSHAYGKLNFK